MWVIIIIFFLLVFPSLCDADRKSCLSGIATIVIIIAMIYGLSALHDLLHDLWEYYKEAIIYAILALIVIAIIWASIRACIDSAKRNKKDNLIKQILSNARCPYCQSKNIILPNYYGIIHDINKQQLYCQDCRETWYYKEE